MQKEKLKIKNGRAARRCFLIFNFAFLILRPALATGVNANWDNGAANSDFANAVNWATNTLPNTGYNNVGDYIRIDLAGANKAVYSATLDNPGTGATSTQAGIFSRLQIGDVSGNGELEIAGGKFWTDSTSTSIIGSSGRTGTLTVTGANADVGLGGYVILGNGTAGTGVVNVASGSFSSSRDGTVGGISKVSLALGNGSNARGTITMSGGRITTRTGLLLGVPGTTGIGRFEVRGGGTAVIGAVDTADDGFWFQNTNSILAAYVTNGMLGTIFIEKTAPGGGTYTNGNVTFMSGSKLEVGFLGTPTPGSWTLMRWGGTVTNNGLSFVAGTDPNWSFSIDNTNGLVITYGTPPTAATNAPFVHPGVMHSLVDLDRMKTNVLAANNPWFMGYTNMLADSHSSSSYVMEGPLGTINRDAVVPSLPSEWQDDCGAAYQNALLWYLTGDRTHAFRAIEILDAWSSTCTNFSGSDARLTAGLQGFKFIAAAELIRHTGAGWSQPEINTCSNFIRNVILPENRMYGGGNWGQIGGISALAAGVFLNDEAVFNEALNCIKYGAPIECDMGIQNYIDPTGFTMEADRDLGHWGLALDDLTEGAATAWCQGVDLWTFLNNRLFVAHEYLGQYALTTNVPSYTAYNQCDGMSNGGLTTTGLGTTWAPFWERAFNTYQNLIGLSAPWSSNMVNVVRPEGYDRDHVAFGTLVSALPPRAAGLPVLPSGLTATWSNAQVKLVWNAASNAVGYVVKRAIMRGGPYTNISTVIAGTNYTDGTVANNVLYFYKVSATNAVGETANSGLATAYPSATAPTAPTGLTAETISHSRIDLAWNSVLGATSYSIKRATTSGGPYTTIASGQGTVFLTYADTGLTPGTTYYYVITATNSIGASSISMEASAATLSALPASWTYADAGYQTTPGNATYSNGTFTVQGAGLDYGGGNSDSFGFAYLNLSGDGTIIARFAARTNYSGLAKTGIAMRESLANGSKHVFLLFDGTGTNGFIYRTSSNGGGTSSGSTNVGGALPEWLKLNRTGNVFTGSVSTDGTNWTIVNARSITMNNTLLVGFAVCSRNNGWLDTATFDNVSVTGLWPALPAAPSPLVGVAGDAFALLSWSAAANATGYNLKRGGASGGPFTLIATNLSGLAFTNTGLANGALYYYIVSGMNDFGESADSSAVSVRPVSTVPPQLGFALVANQMQFNWPTSHVGWKLQVQTNTLATGLRTNWSTLASSVGTNQMSFPIVATNNSVFFRLVYP